MPQVFAHVGITVKNNRKYYKLSVTNLWNIGSD